MSIQTGEGINELTAVVVNTSSANATDGSIQVNEISGGDAPYTFMWNDGAVSLNRENLAVGTYTLIVTDSNGCQTEQDFTISFNTSSEDIYLETEVSIFPNPMQRNQVLHITSSQEIKGLKLYNQQGQLIKVFSPLNDIISYTKAGMFLLEIQLENDTIVWQKWLVL